MPADGFYARHVDGLTLRNVTLTLTNSDVRPAIVFVDVSDARLAETPPPVVQP